jgi:hypothetical protein
MDKGTYIEDKIRVSCTSTNFVWISRFRSDKPIIRSATKYKLAHLVHLNVECTLVLSSFNQSWNVLTNVTRTFEYQISLKFIQSFSSCLLHAERRIDTNVIPTLRETLHDQSEWQSDQGLTFWLTV